MPFYTALLSTEDYGAVELINTYVNLLLSMVIFQIGDALFRFVIDVRKDIQEKRRVVSTILLFCIFQCLMFSLIWSMADSFITLPYKEYLYCNVISNVFSSVLLQLCRGLGDNMTYSIGSFIIAGSAILANILFVLFLHMGAKGLLLATFLSHLLGSVYIFLKKKVYILLRIRWFDYDSLRRMLGYAMPLIPNYLCWWVLGASDKTIVSYCLGISSAGILSVAQKFSTAYTTIYNVFNLTWTEHASVHKDDKDRDIYYNRIIEKTFCCLIAMCLLMIACVGLVFPLLVHKNFDAAYQQIPIYLLAAFVHSVIGIFSVVYIAQKKTKEIAKTSFVAAVINLVVNACLINKIGLFAASISSVTAYMILFWIRYYDIQKYVRIKLERRLVYSCLGMFIIIFGLYYIRSIVASILNVLIAFGYSLYMNKDMVQRFFSIGIKRKGMETYNDK